MTTRSDKRPGLALVLHLHHPFVPAGSPDGADRRWWHSTVTRALVPLLETLEAAPGARPALSLSVPLLHSVASPERMATYERHLRAVADSGAASEMDLAARERVFSEWRGDLLGAVRRRMDAAEPIGSPVTFGYLPLLEAHPASLAAQVELGRSEFHRLLGQSPEGFWLPAHGCSPGIDATLSAAGIRWAVTDPLAILRAHPRPPHGTRSGLRTRTGVNLVAPTPSVQERLESALLSADSPIDSTVAEIADAAKRVGERLGREPLTLVAVDVHRLATGGAAAWKRLAQLLDLTSGPRAELPLTSIGDQLARATSLPCCEPAVAGATPDGANETLLSDRADWAFRHLLEAGQRLERSCSEPADVDALVGRARDQAARELLLAQSSDWLMMMAWDTQTTHAITRMRGHLSHLHQLLDQVDSRGVDATALEVLEKTHDVVPRHSASAFARP